MLLPSALGSSPHPPVSVYSTGAMQTIAAFLGTRLTRFPTYSSVRVTLSDKPGGFADRTPPSLARGFPFRARALLIRPHSSVT